MNNNEKNRSKSRGSKISRKCVRELRTKRKKNSTQAIASTSIKYYDHNSNLLICLANGTEIRRNNTIQILRWTPQHTVSCCFDSFFILCLVDFHFQWFIVVCLKSAYFVYKYRPSYRVCIIILYNLRKNHNTIQTLFKHKRSHKNKKNNNIFMQN